MNTGEEGKETLVSSLTAAGIRERYQAFNEILVFPSTIAGIQARYQALYALSIPMSALAEALDARILRSTFDVYLSSKSPIYHKQDCRLGDALAPFFLHIIPVDETDLPVGRLQIWVRQSGFLGLEPLCRQKEEDVSSKDQPLRLPHPSHSDRPIY